MPPKEDYLIKETKPSIDGGITSANHKLTLVEQVPILYVKVGEASNLPVIQAPAYPCGLYVVLKVGNYEAITPSINPNGLTPTIWKWNQVFAFKKASLQGKNLDILMRNKQPVRDEIIGRMSVVIADIPTRLPCDCPLAPQWYKLEDPKGLAGGGGDLMLAMWVGNQADDEFTKAWHSDAATVSVENMANTRPMVYYSPSVWYLRVKVMEARDLVILDPNRKPEVYVKATLGNVVLRTKVSNNKSENPSWNEELMFAAAEPFEDPLILSVEDEDRENHTKFVLGTYVLPLQKVDKRQTIPPPSDKWFNLERHQMEGADKMKEVRFASKLHLTVFLDGVYHVFDESAQFSSDLRATSPKLKPGKLGVFELGISKAESLAPMKSKKGSETTNAYCVARYGPKWVRTSTVVNSSAPSWNEQFEWEVYDICTVIKIVVFDNCNLQAGGGGARDAVIGSVKIRLSRLSINRLYTHAIPLLVVKRNGLKKMGVLHLNYRFCCASFPNVLWQCLQPLLPITHYTNSLSVYQIESLRSQAVSIIASRLARANPPLRPEVVEFLSDMAPEGGNVFSLRRVRANIERVKACLSFLGAAWKWIHDVRQWKNPVTSFLCWVVLLMLNLFPGVILPSFFVYLFILGLRNYFTRRPKHHPHVDPILSQADNVDPDELDEEFDTFPTSAPPEIVRLRYDRMRSIGLRIQTTIGDLASQLERVHALLSWEDQRATFLFMVLCLISFNATFMFPGLLRWWLSFIATYLMRVPRLRVTRPSILQNLLRRMPSREDCMI